MFGATVWAIPCGSPDNVVAQYLGRHKACPYNAHAIWVNTYVFTGIETRPYGFFGANSA